MKNELKLYDQAFLSQFNRVPGRAEKEPLRNLYMYYKKLKVALTKALKSGAPLRSNLGSRDNSLNYSGLKSDASIDTMNPEEIKAPEPNLAVESQAVLSKYNLKNKVEM